MIAVQPENAVFLLLSFEGPDPYSLAGGLGVRMSGLAQALASRGFETHLVFYGDPFLPSSEDRGHLRLYRWGQHLSRQYPLGVYHGEQEKLQHLTNSFPEFATALISDVASQHKRLIVMAEDWQTVPALMETSDRLWRHGLRNHATLIWNANNIIGFDTIDWHRLAFVSHLTTVSRFMKHTMWNYHVNPTVIPNGLGLDAYSVAPNGKNPLQALKADLTFVKVARFDPDKRWLMAMDAIASLKSQNIKVRALVRGGMESYGNHVRDHARHRGLIWEPMSYKIGWEEDLAQITADVIEVVNRIPDPVLHGLYHHADGVLANSGMEPFGLVGLEVMAQGGIAITGATGEDYVIPYYNALVVDTDDPEEMAHHGLLLMQNPALAASIRTHGPVTAEQYRWDRVVEGLLYRVADFHTHLK
jgi:glycosyltransferase involved in cell wall biosynthesis